jgi:hypothetical protein
MAGERADQVLKSITDRVPGIADFVRLEAAERSLSNEFDWQSSGQPASYGTVYVAGSTDSSTIRSGFSWIYRNPATIRRAIFCVDAESGFSAALGSSSVWLFEETRTAIRVYSRTVCNSDPEHIRTQCLREKLARTMHET